MEDPPADKSALSSRCTVNTTPTKQTGAAYPEANLNTKIGRKIVGDIVARRFLTAACRAPKIRRPPARGRQKAQTDIRVCRSICHREDRLSFVEPTQKVSAVSGRAKKE